MDSGNSWDDPDSYRRLRQAAPLHQLTTDGLLGRTSTNIFLYLNFKVYFRLMSHHLGCHICDCSSMEMTLHLNEFNYWYWEWYKVLQKTASSNKQILLWTVLVKQSQYSITQKTAQRLQCLSRYRISVLSNNAPVRPVIYK